MDLWPALASSHYSRANASAGNARQCPAGRVLGRMHSECWLQGVRVWVWVSPQRIQAGMPGLYQTRAVLGVLGAQACSGRLRGITACEQTAPDSRKPLRRQLTCTTTEASEVSSLIGYGVLGILHSSAGTRMSAKETLLNLCFA